MTQRSFNLIRTLIQLVAITNVLTAVQITHSSDTHISTIVFSSIAISLTWAISPMQYENLVQYVLMRAKISNLPPDDPFINIASDPDFLSFLEKENTDHRLFRTAKDRIRSFGFGIIVFILHNAPDPMLRLFGIIISLLCLIAWSVATFAGIYCGRQVSRYLSQKTMEHYQDIKDTLDDEINKR